MAVTPRTKEKAQEYRRAYYERHGEKIRERNRERNRTMTPETRRRYFLKYRYGITEEVYDEMTLAQGGACAICKQVPKERLGVDHDHDTGSVRGLLCRRCNMSLVLFDDPVLYRNALTYLGRT